jgi:histidinol-phosphate aminotransferase
VAALPLRKPLAGAHNAAPGDLLLHLGEAWYEPAPAVLEALAGIGSRVKRYPDTYSMELRKELAAYCGGGVSEENIYVGNGSDWLIDLLMASFAGLRRPVVAPAPTFFVYGQSAALREAPVRTVGRRPQAEGFALDADALVADLAKATGLVFLASPNNPTGDQLDQATVARIAEATDALVVIDECYFEFAGKSAIKLLAKFPNLCLLRSLSKSFALAGLRAGYLVAHPEVIEAVTRADQTFTVNVAAQTCALAALRSLDYYQPLFERTAVLRKEMASRLTKIGLKVFPSRANILLAEYSSVEPLAPKLRERGIHVADFHVRPGLERCIRITVDERPAIERLATALLEIRSEA